MDGWMDGWMGGWMDGCVYRRVSIYTYVCVCTHACLYLLLCNSFCNWEFVFVRVGKGGGIQQQQQQQQLRGLNK